MGSRRHFKDRERVQTAMAKWETPGASGARLASKPTLGQPSSLPWACCPHEMLAHLPCHLSHLSSLLACPQKPVFKA